jgi:hypothetical protein
MTDEQPHRLWTFRIRGGESFSFQLEGNPQIDHGGSVSVFHLMLTAEQVPETVAFIESHAATVLDYRQMEGQTDEQREERRKYIGIGQDNRVWPSASCPECFWFDPAQEEPCGFLGWDQSAVLEAVRCHPKSKTDLAACPLERGV